jgi:hypothetical protein
MFARVYGNDISLESVRSFFGVHKVIESHDGRFHILTHGTTIHGAQRVRDEAGRLLTGRPEPIAYFGARSPMAIAFAAARERKDNLRIAVVGLGAGTLACYTRPGDVLDFYEIDPAVVRIASDPRYFTYLSSCAPDAKIIVGDARLTLAEAPDAGYDLIVMDAFSSDAVPVHLMTREAMAMYLRKLAPGGMVLMHVMNRYMELASVAAGIAAANGAVTRVMHTSDIEDEDNFVFVSSVAAIARTDADFGSLARSPQWPIQPVDPRERVWTDDYSNIIGAILRHQRG